jgi:tRNA(Arg) A34 adenosine deaminase TadA
VTVFKKYSKCLEIARAMKPLSQEIRNYHVAFVFKKNKIVSISANKKRTHPKNLKFDYHKHQPGIHSELGAILKAKKDNFKKHTMFVVRIDNNGEAAYSKCCPGCSGLVKSVGMEKVFYSISETKFGTL